MVTVPKGGTRPMTWNRRPKKASLIAVSDRKSSGRDGASRSHSNERGLRGGSGGVSLRTSLPSAKRNSYCDTQDSVDGFGAGASDSHASISGAPTRW